MRLVILLLFISCSSYGQNEFQKLIGRWEGIQGRDTLTLVFDTDTVITMSNKNDRIVIGGRDNIRKGKKVRMIYAVDTSQKPFGIDFIIEEIEGKVEQGRMKGIIEFLSDKEIRIDFGPSKDRPVAFGQSAVNLIKKE